MLDRRAARSAKTLRFGHDRLRLRPWASEAGTGLLILLTSGSAVSDTAVAASIESAGAQGYLRIRTSALSHIEAEPFLRAGFESSQQLALLSRPIQPGFREQNGDLAIRRARRGDHPSVLAVDHAAFEPFWQLDPVGLREALRATPFRRFRVARRNSDEALAGYAISGRSGPSGYLQRLAISPNQQGQGAGTALVIDGLTWMARWGATQAWVNTPQHNTGALRLYERLGFEPIPPGLQVLEMEISGP
ncbi:MAG: GNAT family N-acetyltransferase [bacterium]|nr:GNAT family N-acetyltransferase [bacterium]